MSDVSPTLTFLEDQRLIFVAQAGVGSVGGNSEVVLSAAAEVEAEASSRVLDVTLRDQKAEAGMG